MNMTILVPRINGTKYYLIYIQMMVMDMETWHAVMGRKELDTTEQLSWLILNMLDSTQVAPIQRPNFKQV